MYIKKDLHSAPDVETLQTEIPYAISINPIEEWNPSQLPMTWVIKSSSQIVECMRGVEMTLYPESSPTGRLHYHGLIIIKDIIEYLSFLNVYKKYGSFCIKDIAKVESTKKERAERTKTKVPRSQSSDRGRDQIPRGSTGGGGSSTPDERTGEISIDEGIYSAETWLSYCTKQQHIFEPQFAGRRFDYPLRLVPPVRLTRDPR